MKSSPARLKNPPAFHGCGVRGILQRSHFVTASLMILWIGGYLMPSMQPAERLTGQLNRISNRARADIAISVRNFTMDESWGKRDEQPFASQLATLASLVKVSQDNRDFPVFASDYKISPVGETSFGFSLPAADWMTLALVSPGDPAVNNLFNGLPSELVAAQSRNFFGNDTTASLSHPEICQTCSLNLNESDSIQSPGALQDKMTSGSALQILNAFEMITDTTTPEGALASNALIANQDYAGLTRYLVRAPWLLHCGIQTETTREEVLIVDKGVRSKWGVVMLYNSQVPSRARVDSLPNRLFAEVGWRLYCYFDALPPLVPSGLQASGELPETAF